MTLACHNEDSSEVALSRKGGAVGAKQSLSELCRVSSEERSECNPVRIARAGGGCACAMESSRPHRMSPQYGIASASV